MKRLVILTAFIVIVFASIAQTGLYKRYASRLGVQAYCVERYPMGSGDSVCVTLLQTDDSTVYNSVIKELHKLPYATRKTAKVESEVTYTFADEKARQKTDSLALRWHERKHLVIFNANGLPGDKGYYAIYCPSDRMVILAFLITSDDEAHKVAGHMISEL